MRPFGVSLLVIGFDAKKGPSLYQVDPSVCWLVALYSPSCATCFSFSDFFSFLSLLLSLLLPNIQGSFFAWKAAAIGKNMVNAKTFLEKRYNEEMELEDAVHTAILTLKEGFEGQMTENNIEIGIVNADGFRRLEVGPAYLGGI